MTPTGTKRSKLLRSHAQLTAPNRHVPGLAKSWCRWHCSRLLHLIGCSGVAALGSSALQSGVGVDIDQPPTAPRRTASNRTERNSHESV
jgi:hypothetical protein